MKTLVLSLFAQTRRALAGALFALVCVPALAVTFTNNTAIGVGNTNYDGEAIVINNCTVTMDGLHTFANVEVAAGGVLTHSFYAGGVISNLLFITNESQVLTSTNPVTLLNSNVLTATVFVTDITGMMDYTNGLDYLLTSTNGVLTELERTTNSSIPDGATVLVSYEVLLSATPAGLNLIVTDNVQVDAGGAINANGIGYGGGLGSGAGHSAGSPEDGSGGGYGGIGGNSSSNALGGATYGSFTEPFNLGSGGGAGYAGFGGAGGGLIEILAGSNMIVNGSISANGGNGTNSRSGGGSGGSVWLTAATLSGSGMITATGGSGEGTHGGGGGGGRIALQCSASSFAGPVAAYGGVGANIGGAGTVFTQLEGQNGLLLVDNGGQAGTNTTIAVTNQSINVLIRGNAGVMPSTAWTVGNLTIASNGLMLAIPSTAINLTASGAITIEAGGGLLANAAGSAQGLGAGRGIEVDDFAYCGGGGYGGNGATSSPTNGVGGSAYGGQAIPSGFGSGGGTYPPESFGGNGGGAIQITSLGGIVQVNGTLSANGGNGSGYGGGGGSGGTIVLTGGTLFGSGSIAANGGYGASSVGGGGGGGRIAISPTASQFAGTISAYGGGGGNWGGAGTILLQVPGLTAQLILDNDGHAGTNTPLQTASIADLIVRGGAVGSVSGSVAFDDLYLDTNGWLTPAFTGESPPESSLNVSFTGNAMIQAGGGIVADSGGYPEGQGPGLGATYIFGSTNLGGGGGHGGRGGASFGNYAIGGSTYDSLTSPTDPGSGGGPNTTGSQSGTGGGVIKLSVTGALELNGIITANGGNGGGLAGGGGAGGSIWLAVGTLSGVGSIAANGGSGAESLGGGGGGGMIYIPCTNNSFAGTLSAYGGAGANWGGPGTAIIEVTGHNNQLVLDNGGHAGPPTPLTSSTTTDLTLRNGAVGLVSSTLSLGNLLISSNASLLVTNTQSLIGLSFSTATIQAGGGIIADSEGAPAGQGEGDGHSLSSPPNYPCSGAGHGGYGASSAGNAATGGNAYDYPPQPEFVGSGGGSFAPYSLGGAGGGGIRLTVTGLLQNDGVISANGGNGMGLGGGGGSGGSIFITTGSLSGGGSISANGGNGAGSVGGGGAGGCVAIYPTVNQFAGTMTAYGGGGANRAGAGTIYIQPAQQTSQFILDNDGQYGAATPISSISSAGLYLRNGAVGLATGSLNLTSILISSNAQLLVSNSSSVVSLTFSTVTIQAGGGLIADSGGSAAGSGQGQGHSNGNMTNYPCSGAGHGGYGANSVGNVVSGGIAYDSPIAPNLPGSGGGLDSPFSLGGAGGGAIRLTVTGLLQNDGVVSANGGNGGGLGGGGGSGGSIYITAGSLSGAGSISANGGSGGSVGGGGAGGCIALYPTANQFTGRISAYGGGGANWGGAGTIYIQTTGQSNQFILDNDGQYGASTPIQSAGTFNLTLRNGAVGVGGTFLSQGSLLISSNAELFATNFGSQVQMSFSSVTIQPGGSIIADSDGFAAGQGTGAGRYYAVEPSYPCSGGGHGGNGGNSEGNLAVGGGAYDTQAQPNSLGSGGGTESPYSPGGAGGGAMRITVSGLLQNDGAISANGGNGGGIGGGGGAGGSIYITAGTLAGAGSIRANGGSGAGSIGGGGAGGCIALYPTANEFVGTISAYGGGGANSGAAGTIYMQIPNQTSQFILDNDGQYGAATPIQAISAAFILRNGATAYVLNPPQTIFSLLVSSNSWLMANPVSGNNAPGLVNLTVTGNATVLAGGGIVTDSAGSAASTGTGAGMYLGGYANDPCSGAGYGGYGGSALGSTVAGGTAYGSATSPASNGSGGGSESPFSIGGAGGGSIHLTVNGTLEADGKISANGGNGGGLGGGAGSGGSIWLTVGTMTGAGSITANGGSGAEGVGGGGGGGRISIGYAANDFGGLISAAGGGGYAHGGAGTLYTKATSQSVGQLLLDNGGAPGTNTPLSSALGLPTQPFNLTIQNGASVSSQTSFPLLSNLTVGSGGRLTALTSQTILDLLVFNNVDVAPGGVIVVDGLGYPQARGPGAGQSIGAEGSGAGYGGAGGASATAPGGVTYGSSNQPVDFGSGGGSGYGPAIGGSQGGGTIRLSVGGILTVDGLISADGEPGLQDNAGGGSGGSIWLTAGALAGAGQFTANGGTGDLYGGGGGAGGRIALYSQADDYFGLATASGAEGDFAGAAGTIYSNTVPSLQILSNSPNGIVSNAISSVIVYFNGAPNPNSVAVTDFTLTTPNGPLASSSLTISMLSSASYLLSFPQQTSDGIYSLVVGTNITDLYGQPLSPVFAGGFTISLPVIEGTITDTGGDPIEGVLLQASGGLTSSTTTDTNGNYALSFLPGISFTVTPSLGALIFVPSSLSYTNVSATVPNQNYVAATTPAPLLTAAVNSTNFVLGWSAIPGVNYQVYSSTDLTNWVPYGNAVTGSNGPVQIQVPTSSNSAQFFSVQAGN